MAGSPTLSRHAEWRRFGNLRGTSVVATRLFFDRDVRTPYTANACWGFDEGVGMTFFDLRRLHAPAFDDEPGAVVELDFYHCGTLLPLDDAALTAKALAASPFEAVVASSSKETLHESVSIPLYVHPWLCMASLLLDHSACYSRLGRGPLG